MNRHTLFEFSRRAWPAPHFEGLAEPEDALIDQYERIIFAHAFEHEHFLYEHRGSYRPPSNVAVTWKQLDSSAINKLHHEELERVFRIPAFHDFCQLEICQLEICQLEIAAQSRAPAILYTSCCNTFDAIATSPIPLLQSLFLINGSGLPRFSTRKFIAKASRTLNAPVFVLSDCDEWGIFICSMLLSGMLFPGMNEPLLSSEQVHFLGIDPSDAAKRFHHLLYNNNWDLSLQRITALADYPCFSDPPWKSLLSELQAMQSKLRIHDVLNHLGHTAFNDYVAQALQRQPWLHGKTG